MDIIEIQSTNKEYAEFFYDESRYRGSAESISFPENEEQIISIINNMRQKGREITIQGGKTGITGASVPRGGHLMNLSKMGKRMKIRELEGKQQVVDVEPGVTIMELKQYLNQYFKGTSFIWPPNPTEELACIGGIAATAARGPNAFYYKDTRNYVHGFRLILANGEILDVERGKETIHILNHEMDVVDAILGSEGKLGVFSQLTLYLRQDEVCKWGICFFFLQQEDAAIFVDQLKENGTNLRTGKVMEVEFFDKETIQRVQQRKSTMHKIKDLPHIKDSFECMISLELGGEEADVEALAEQLMEWAILSNCDPEEAWAVVGEQELARIKAFRHAAAEVVNVCVDEAHQRDSRITKLGTDMCVESQNFSEVLEKYKRVLKQSGVEGCIFGHAMSNHLHMNFLPQNFEEYEKGIQAIKELSKWILDQGGETTFEHGVGKLKKQILGDLVSKDRENQLEILKKKYDENNLWGR